MEIVLNFLLNYITLAVAGVAFVIILVALFAKRKSLSQNTKLIFTVLLIILAVYFVFIIWITIAAGGNQPANSPTPVNPSIEELTENEVVEFHGQLFNKSDLSEETLEWLEWYNSLSPEEQLAVSSIPADLYTNDGAGSTIADAPPMVCVNDTLYKQSTKQTSYNELKDDFVYLGVIESDITNLQNNSNGNASDGIPKENFQANHPIVGAKVYQYGNDIVVEIEGKYWLYEQLAVSSIPAEKKTEQPPRIYDLTTLQREANRLFGFTAKQTLDYAQQLYEKKLLTYPRTDSQYLTDDMQPTAESIVSGLWPLLPFAAGLDISPQFGRVLNSKKVSDHHAIIPTMEFVQKGFDGLTEGEKKLLSLVCCKLLCAVAAPHVFEAVTATITCAGKEFTAKGKTILTPGWKEIDRRFRASFKADADEDAPELARELPELAEGQTFDKVEASVTEHFTTPPKPYTEDTLLSAMERAGAEDMPEDAERQGLGTPATRASILEKLVQMGFVERKGKQLLPTKDGHNLACVLPDVLTSPQLTAEWENTLTAIAKGEADPDGFMAGIEEMTQGLISGYSQISEDAQKLFQKERVAIGKCPRCGEAVYEGKKNYYCGNRACQFVMWKNDRFFEERGKAFTPKIAAALLKDGKAKVKGLRSMKTGKTYDGTVLLADTGGKYVNYRIERGDKN